LAEPIGRTKQTEPFGPPPPMDPVEMPASSLLGSRALSDGLQAWDWVAVVLLFAIGALAVVMLWPYYNFSSRFDVEELLSQYVDAEGPATMTEMCRALAVRLKRYQQRNQRIIRRIREAFQLA
jgi:hypothetical protein